MNINKDTKLNDIFNAFPMLKDGLVALDSKFEILKNPVAAMMINNFSIGDLADKVGINIDDVISKITGLIGKQ